MRRIKITIEHMPEDVYVATSADLPGYVVECEDGRGIFDLARKLALEFLHLDGEAAAGEKIAFDFELKG